MNTHAKDLRAVPGRAPYRITLVGTEWHVQRPHASLSHAFQHLHQAESFIRNDSGDRAAIVEIVAGTVYMVKTL
jgi:hypothetical protein